MFERALMFFCFILVCQLATAQVCYDYPCVIAKIKTAIEKADYNTAFDNLESASKYRNSNPEEISQLRKLLFDSINQEKIKAQEEEARSRRLLQQVQAESQRAESAEADVDRLAQEKEQQEKLEKLRMENAEIAAHNRNLADRVKENDPSLALNILKYNLDNFPEDELTRATYNALSQRVQNEIACIAVPPEYLVDPFLFDNYSFSGIKSVAISRDGKRCFFAFYDQVVFWDVLQDTGRVVINGKIIRDIKVDSSGSKMIYLDKDFNLFCLNIMNNKDFKIQGAPLTHYVYDPFNDLLNNEVIKHDAIGGYRPLKRWAPQMEDYKDEGEPTDSIISFSGSITSFDIEPGGSFCIVGDEYGNVFKWELSENKVYEFNGMHYQEVKSVSIADKSPFVLTASNDGIARLWRTNEESSRTIQAYLGHKDNIYEAALAPDRSICISLSIDGTMKWWDVEKGRVIRSINYRSPEDGLLDMPYNIQFTPEGTHFLMADNVDQVSIWNLKGEAEEYAEITYPYAVAENTVLSIGQDGRPRLFQIRALGHCENDACEGYVITTDEELMLEGVLLKKELVQNDE